MFGRKKKKKSVNPLEMGPDVEFKATGAASDQENQANAIQARQSPGIAPTKVLVAQAMDQNANRVLVDYTAQGVAIRFDVDGFWHNLPSMDRKVGDVMLAVMKKLANLDPADRRSRQAGEFKVTYRRVLRTCQITTQGVETGERVIIRVVDPKQEQMSLEDLGMRESMAYQFMERVGRATGEEEAKPPTGIYVLSAPANGGGLSSLWAAGLMATDRYTGDFLGIEEKTRREPEVENVDVQEFDESQGEKAADIVPKMMLRQPDVFTVPHIADKETLDTLCMVAETEGIVTITSVRAKSAAEALNKLLSASTNKSSFIKFINLVVNMRLVRRLCEECKVPFQPSPAILQQLQLPPERIQVLYQEYQPPPVDPQAPKNKKNAPPPVCPNCGGLGYSGRIGIFEMLIVDDNIRQALAQQSAVDVLHQLAAKTGMRSLREEGIGILAQGITSIPELQRALQ